MKTANGLWLLPATEAGTESAASSSVGARTIAKSASGSLPQLQHRASLASPLAGRASGIRWSTGVRTRSRGVPQSTRLLIDIRRLLKFSKPGRKPFLRNIRDKEMERDTVKLAPSIVAAD